MAMFCKLEHVGVVTAVPQRMGVPRSTGASHITLSHSQFLGGIGAASMRSGDLDIIVA